MAEGKKSLKKKLTKPLVSLFRKTKKGKDKENENATNKSVSTNQTATNRVHEEAPFDNLLKKLEKLEIDKKARLEGTANLDNDSIYGSASDIEKELCAKSDKKDNGTDNEISNFEKSARNDCNYTGQDNDAAELLEKFNELEIVKKEISQDDEDDEELKKFCTKFVSDDARTFRVDSESSQDSGLGEECSLVKSEKSFDKDVDRIDDKDGEEEKKDEVKQNKLRKAYLKRGPIKSNKRSQAAVYVPYPCEINLNPEIYSGGQVTVNINQFDQQILTETSTEHQVPSQSNDFPNDIINLSELFTKEEIDLVFRSVPKNDFPQNQFILNSHNSRPAQYDYNLYEQELVLFQHEWNNIGMDVPRMDEINLNENVIKDLDDYILTDSSVQSHSMYSPQNRNIESPLKYIATSPDSDALSLNEELEQFRALTLSESTRKYEKLKDYKARQRELEEEFQKMEIPLKPCKEIFKEHLQKLKEEERRILFHSVARLELKHVFTVLIQTLLELSKNDQPHHVQMSLFCLVCEKVLSIQKTLFVEDFGLNLLQFAVLRCYKWPVITRYLVECIRVVTRGAEYQCPNKVVFTEVDANGDNLLIACVRQGDKCATALRELVRSEANDIPLFNVDLVNVDGYTALHVCCSEHSARTPRAHTLHVLLKHAKADQSAKDKRGGETPLHLAVSSAHCSLDIVLIYFYPFDQTQWYSLARMENLSNLTPYKYAKNGNISRTNYPREILDFLERCRNIDSSKGRKQKNS